MRGRNGSQGRAGWRLALLLWLAAAVALAGPRAPEEYLDEETAATITVVGAPLVFANERRDLGANARDYATVAAAAVNRAGKISYVVITYFWSTVDPRLRTDPVPSPAVLSLQADDRRIELHLDGHSAHEAGIGRPVYQPPGSPVAPNVYHTDLPTLRFLSQARHLKLISDSEVAAVEFPLWEDQRAALQTFVRHLSGED